MYTNHSSVFGLLSFVRIRIRYSVLQETVPRGVPMAYDETLAARIWERLSRRKNIEEKKMFGGIGFLLNGNLLVGVWKESVCVRLGPEQAQEALLEPQVKGVRHHRQADEGLGAGPTGRCRR
jgi:hypothetical protein